jgi:hypothetical protein
MLARLCCGTVVVLGCADANAACPPAGMPRVRSRRSSSPNGRSTTTLVASVALELLDCLGGPDPTLKTLD